MLGGVVTQWPAGLISDRVDRRLVVAFLAFLALAACIALYLTAGRVSFSITVLLAALWGGGALSFYSISASHATDRTDAGQIAQVMSGMLFIWAGGSVLGRYAGRPAGRLSRGRFWLFRADGGKSRAAVHPRSPDVLATIILPTAPGHQRRAGQGR